MRRVRVITAAAMLLVAAAAGCGSDGDDDAAMHGSEPAPVHTETKTETTETKETAAFARLEPAAFEERMSKSEAAAVINVHIPYEGELADTDAFIPYNKILGDARLPQDKNGEILLYCRSGTMSEEAGAVLNKAGYTKVAHLEGGMKAWQASGRELFHDPGRAAEPPPGEHS